MDIAAWLGGLGLEQYAPAFRDNDVDGEVLPDLTADDLISIGVTSVGHRRKLLAAIAALCSDVPPVAARVAPAAAVSADAERRQLTVMFCESRRLHRTLGAPRPRGSARGHRCISSRRR
jgi:hypothetical protein